MQDKAAFLYFLFFLVLHCGPSQPEEHTFLVCWLYSKDSQSQFITEDELTCFRLLTYLKILQSSVVGVLSLVFVTT